MKREELKIRTRIAPSPTGSLHIGTARAALFNYLFAKKHNGSFILRIEDTDIERSDPKWDEDILKSLEWLRIKWDEGPIPISQREIGKTQNPKPKIQNNKNDYMGDYGPYRQSERLDTYAKYLEKLLKEDKAYYCFCSEEELENQRKKQMNAGQAPRYSGNCRNLSEKEIAKNLAAGKKSIIRFRLPNKKVKFRDLIRGDLEFDSGLIGDIAIAKNLSAPLYNFAVAIDDFEMKISHVIRGEDHISNTPKQILIQEALGLPRPEYAHIPLILGADRGKLSKRHGATSVIQYKQEGYLPETLVNFMAFLGWNPDSDQEIFSIKELIEGFSLEKVQKGGAIFNIQKLDYLNGFYIRQKPLNELAELCVPYLEEAGLISNVKCQMSKPNVKCQNLRVLETKEIIDFEQIMKIVGLYQGRLKKLSEIPELIDFFFKDVLKYDKELLRWKKMNDEEIRQSFDKLENLLSKIKEVDWTKENLEKTIMPAAEEIGDRGKLLWPFRVAITGKKASAGPFEIAEVLGKEKTLERINKAKNLL